MKRDSKIDSQFFSPEQDLIDLWQQEVHGVVDWSSVFLLLVLVSLHQLVQAGKGTRPAGRFYKINIKIQLIKNL
jgi:hypothetical protein